MGLGTGVGLSPCGVISGMKLHRSPEQRQLKSFTSLSTGMHSPGDEVMVVWQPKKDGSLLPSMFSRNCARQEISVSVQYWMHQSVFMQWLAQQVRALPGASRTNTHTDTETRGTSLTPIRQSRELDTFSNSLQPKSENFCQLKPVYNGNLKKKKYLVLWLETLRIITSAL